jgi:hypothetical protein
MTMDGKLSGAPLDPKASKLTVEVPARLRNVCMMLRRMLCHVLCHMVAHAISNQGEATRQSRAKKQQASSRSSNLGWW